MHSFCAESASSFKNIIVAMGLEEFESAVCWNDESNAEAGMMNNQFPTEFQLLLPNMLRNK